LSEGKVRLLHQQNELNETLALNFHSFNPENPDSDKFKPLLVLSKGKVRLLHQQNELNETLALNFQSFNPENPDSDKFLKIHCTYHL